MAQTRYPRTTWETSGSGETYLFRGFVIGTLEGKNALTDFTSPIDAVGEGLLEACEDFCKLWWMRVHKQHANLVERRSIWSMPLRQCCTHQNRYNKSEVANGPQSLVLSLQWQDGYVFSETFDQ
jgi:hypothetical protein